MSKVSAPESEGEPISSFAVADKPTSMSGGLGGVIGEAMSSPAKAGAAGAPMMTPAVRSFSRSAYSSASAGSVQRKDNNLDELMLDAARKRASDSLKVTY